METSKTEIAAHANLFVVVLVEDTGEITAAVHREVADDPPMLAFLGYDFIPLKTYKTERGARKLIERIDVSDFRDGTGTLEVISGSDFPITAPARARYLFK